MYISRNYNTIIESELGDGFRSLALSNIIESDSIVITSRCIGETHYKRRGYLTIHGTTEYINDFGQGSFKIIIIDVKLPRVESKTHKSLLKLCKGKQILLLNSPRDIRELSSAMELLSVTKNPKLKSIKFSSFQYRKYS